jgi:hypothetical protein
VNRAHLLAPGSPSESVEASPVKEKGRRGGRKHKSQPVVPSSPEDSDCEVEGMAQLQGDGSIPSSPSPQGEIDTSEIPRTLLPGGLTPEPDEAWQHWAERMAIQDEERKILFAQMLSRDMRLDLALRGLAESTLHRGDLLKTMAEASKAQSEHLEAISLAFGNFSKKMEEIFGMLSFGLADNSENLVAERQHLLNDAALLRKTLGHFIQEAPIQAANQTVQQVAPSFVVGGSDPARLDRIEEKRRRQESQRGDGPAAQLQKALHEEDSSEVGSDGEGDESEVLLSNAAGKRKAAD